MNFKQLFTNTLDWTNTERGFRQMTKTYRCRVIATFGGIEVVEITPTPSTPAQRKAVVEMYKAVCYECIIIFVDAEKEEDRTVAIAARSSRNTYKEVKVSSMEKFAKKVADLSVSFSKLEKGLNFSQMVMVIDRIFGIIK